MAEKYYVSDGNGGKEVEIPTKVDPFKSILAPSQANKSEEKVPDPTPTAGDDIVEESKAAFAGKEEAIVPEEPKEIIYGHCNNCRLELTEEKVVKQPIEYIKNEDGSFGKTATRFSVFCKQCMKFVTLIDADAAKMLQNMIKKGIR